MISFFDLIENTVEKGESTGDKHFLLSEKTLLSGSFKLLPYNTAFLHTKDSIAEENMVGKGEIACNKQFLLFSQCFPQLYGTYLPF